jgi:hypothetical protein
MADFNEQNYLDVLQNIEFSIVDHFRTDGELSDAAVGKAMEGLIRVYQAAAQSRPAPTLKLLPPQQKIYATVRETCEKHLGRDPQKHLEADLRGITLAEMIACLKRIEKSIKFWTREGGRQGYLEYIDSFKPE